MNIHHLIMRIAKRGDQHYTPVNKMLPQGQNDPWNGTYISLRPQEEMKYKDILALDSRREKIQEVMKAVRYIISELKSARQEKLNKTIYDKDSKHPFFYYFD